jgi:hypothetical protein
MLHSSMGFLCCFFLDVSSLNLAALQRRFFLSARVVFLNNNPSCTQIFQENPPFSRELSPTAISGNARARGVVKWHGPKVYLGNCQGYRAPRRIVSWPSTEMTGCVTCRALPLTRNRIAAATSSGSPMHAVGVRASTAQKKTGSSVRARSMFVRVVPTARALMCALSIPHSMASRRVSCSSSALDMP